MLYPLSYGRMSRPARAGQPDDYISGSGPSPNRACRWDDRGVSIANLEVLIRSMRPEFRPGEFVFVDGDGLPGDVEVLASVKESEGLSALVSRRDADRLGRSYDFVGAWITLTVYSSLETVGLTAAVAGELAEHGIGCNVIAGLHHDHLLVSADRADDALTALRRLAGRPSPRRILPL
jgi:uncharacterized protein